MYELITFMQHIMTRFKLKCIYGNEESNSYSFIRDARNKLTFILAISNRNLNEDSIQ